MDRLPHENTRRLAIGSAPEACGAADLATADGLALDVGPAWFGGLGRPTPSPEERLARLVRTIEADIIPRLVQAHRGSSDPAAAGPAHAAARTVAEIDPGLDPRAFARLVLQRDERAWHEPVDRLNDRGCSRESICLDLLAPAAQELGEMWTSDTASFADVTIGTGRLMQLMRSLVPEAEAGDVPIRDGRRALLVPAPGEQHTFGIAMVMQFFEQDGWEVVGDVDVTRLDPPAAVSKQWFDVVGFSIGHAARLENLAIMIDRVRHESLNRSIGVLVGGPALADRADLVESVGADDTAVDGRQAPQVADRLLARRHQRRP